jgi:nicotinamidase/pyrazinamidase
MNLPKHVFWEVDVQADFMLPGGKLYVPHAETILPKIHMLVESCLANNTLLVSSADAHTLDDPEFERFPPHCVKGTAGAKIVPGGLAERSLVVPNQESFRWPGDALHYPQIILEKQSLDVFENPHSSELVDRLGEDCEYFVFGVVTEFCVRCAGLGLLRRRRRVFIVTDAIAAIDREEGARALEELRSHGAKMITSEAALRRIGAHVSPGIKGEGSGPLEASGES